MSSLFIEILLIINGVGIAVLWTKDILTNPEIDYSKGFFGAREPLSGNLFWPHWIAEYSTAFLLIVAPVLSILKINTGQHILPFAVGALFYSAFNSLSWAFAKKERIFYTIPMLFALVVCLVYFINLIF